MAAAYGMNSPRYDALCGQYSFDFKALDAQKVYQVLQKIEPSVSKTRWFEVFDVDWSLRDDIVKESQTSPESSFLLALLKQWVLATDATEQKLITIIRRIDPGYVSALQLSFASSQDKRTTQTRGYGKRYSLQRASQNFPLVQVDSDIVAFHLKKSLTPNPKFFKMPLSVKAEIITNILSCSSDDEGCWKDISLELGFNLSFVSGVDRECSEDKLVYIIERFWSEPSLTSKTNSERFEQYINALYHGLVKNEKKIQKLRSLNLYRNI
ncbi:hypothetical protein D5018_10945 [Parashewanella curva]|uniref:Death domain-containing protein n=1 Tax=Parashewanella curva TaxID=2338552 RepID=A0A3L8PYE2_9GAMM|nr:hypothetical protein [Parashewanella curva]RLV59663.1 hypothetical protein D5018_10945 [Parashewanella curva]